MQHREAPHPTGCVGGQTAAPSWPLLPLGYLLSPVSSGQPKPPHIFQLAPSGCPNSRVLLSNKGTWNHRNWVRPSRQIGQARPVKTVCRSLGARGPSASCHPILTWWLTQVGAYDHEGPSKVPGWGEQAQVHHQHQIFDLHPTVQSAQNRSSSSSPFVSSSAFPFLPLASESIL